MFSVITPATHMCFVTNEISLFEAYFSIAKQIILRFNSNIMDHQILRAPRCTITAQEYSICAVANTYGFLLAQSAFADVVTSPARRPN